MRPRLRTVATITLTAGLVAATPQLVANGAKTAERTAAKQVSVNQSYPVPDSGRFTVKGHGYGHGRGMSQHGAQGAAKQGLSHERILDFYYPGTKLERSGKPIRVLISTDTTSDVVVAAKPGLKVRDLGAKVNYRLPQNLGASRWRIAVDSSNRNIVEYLDGSTWKRWSPAGFLVGEGEFRGTGPTTLFTPQGEYRFRGRLRAAMISPGSTDRDTVNVLGLDNYVKGVVPYEMPALWEPEAVQAQSVAARTYGVHHRTRAGDRHYDICDTTACQVYRGVNGEHPASNAATMATSKEILTHGGAPAFTEFSSSNGGWSVASSIPYQVAKQDPYDDWAGNANHNWSQKLTARAIQKAYPKLGKLKRIRVVARDGNGQWKGRVQTLVLDGGRGDVRLTGDEFRWKFGLKSTWFRF